MTRKLQVYHTDPDKMEGIVRAPTSELASIEVGVGTDQGVCPEQMDRYHADTATDFETRGYALFIVYDGHEDVRFADHAKENLVHYIISDPEFIRGNFRQALNNAFQREELALWESFGKATTGGTTVTVALLLRKEEECYFANVGSSTAILGATLDFQDPRAALAISVTKNDKPSDPNELQRLLQAHARFRRNGVVHPTHQMNLTRALGDFDFKAQKTKTGTDWISPVPHIHRVALNPEEDSFIVLASNGLWSEYEEDWVARAVQNGIQKGHGTQKIAEDLTLHKSTRHPRNTTVIVVQLFWRKRQQLE